MLIPIDGITKARKIDAAMELNRSIINSFKRAFGAKTIIIKVIGGASISSYAELEG